jgi:hypothetical protein
MKCWGVRMRMVKVCVVLALAMVSGLGLAQERRQVLERTEWTMSSGPEKVDAALPNVLLVGDSITRAYFPDVAKDLAGKANVYYFASSTSVGDVRLGPQLADYFAMMKLKWAVVHFNNGMHGWGYTEAEYRRYFPELVKAVRDGAPGAKLVWATTTPVRKVQANGASNERIMERNRIAAAALKGDGVTVDDQYGLMIGHQDMHADDIHFNAEGSALQAGQVAGSVLGALGAK